jgi:membrane-associated phospholipid phosphatase
MDAIEGLDWGAYSHFRYLIQQHPEILTFMTPADWLAGYLAVGIFGGIAICLFLAQKRPQAALITLASFVVAVAVAEGTHWVVPRMRPTDAKNVLVQDALFDSYPASGVLLFTLAMILLGAALWRPLATRPEVRVLYVIVAAAVTVWVCMSQFFLATHFVTDVIGALAQRRKVSTRKNRTRTAPLHFVTFVYV